MIFHSVAEILASLCTKTEQKYGDRDFGGRERWLYFSAWQKGRHSRLAPQELCPPILGIREDFTCEDHNPGGVYDNDQSSEGLAFFLSFVLFQNSHRWRQATR